MPAPSSSPIDPAISHLAGLAQHPEEEQPRLLAVLASVTDPRHRRGVRHRLAVVLGLAVCAVLAGARSFTAIAEWAADADRGDSGQARRDRGGADVSPPSGGCCSGWTPMPLMTWPGGGRSSAPCQGRGSAG